MNLESQSGEVSNGSVQWASAAIVSPEAAPSIIQTLDYLRIEYLVGMERGQVHIQVPAHQLDEVIPWIRSPQPAQDPLDAKLAKLPRTAAYSLFIAMPIGILTGSIIAKRNGVPVDEATLVSSLGGLIGGLVGIVIACAIVFLGFEETEQRPSEFDEGD